MSSNRYGAAKSDADAHATTVDVRAGTEYDVGDIVMNLRSKELVRVLDVDRAASTVEVVRGVGSNPEPILEGDDLFIVANAKVPES